MDLTPAAPDAGLRTIYAGLPLWAWLGAGAATLATGIYLTRKRKG